MENTAEILVWIIFLEIFLEQRADMCHNECTRFYIELYRVIEDVDNVRDERLPKRMESGKDIDGFCGHKKITIFLISLFAGVNP